jgi:hypothetical protein
LVGGLLGAAIVVLAGASEVGWAIAATTIRGSCRGPAGGGWWRELPEPVLGGSGQSTATPQGSGWNQVCGSVGGGGCAKLSGRGWAAIAAGGDDEAGPFTM